MIKNRICICCGEVYDYCPNCSNTKTPTWKRLYDTEECKEVAHIFQSSRGDGGISKEDAKKKMEKYPDTLKKIFDYDSLLANAIKEMFGVKVDDKKEKTVTTYSVDESGELKEVDVPEKASNDVDDKNIDSVESTDNTDGESDNKNSSNRKKKYYKK